MNRKFRDLSLYAITVADSHRLNKVLQLLQQAIPESAQLSQSGKFPRPNVPVFQIEDSVGMRMELLV